MHQGVCVQLTDHQEFFLQALGRNGAVIFANDDWEAVERRLRPLWETSAIGRGHQWESVRGIVRESWLTTSEGNGSPG